MVKRYANGEEKEHIVIDQLANMYHCPDCGFEYNAQHKEDDKEGGYICPLCEVAELTEKVKRYESALNTFRYSSDISRQIVEKAFNG